MKLVFMGTPEFAVPSLQALYEAGHDIVGVFTQPDRPAGRGKKMTASPVKILAESLKLPVYQPPKIKIPEVVQTVDNLQPECIVVVAFGQILPPRILELPSYGCVNVHASLLPSYRGAAPIHWAVINGEPLTGVTTMRMDEGLDTGDILLKSQFPISSLATTGEVHDALARIGAELLLKTLEGLVKGTVTPAPQPKDFTYAPLLKREHEKLDWTWEAVKIYNRVRGMNPWPGAFTTFRDEQVKVWKIRLSDKKSSIGNDQAFDAGRILALSENGLLVAAGEGVLEIIEIQPAGKKKMTAHDFFNGRRVKIGESFI